MYRPYFNKISLKSKMALAATGLFTCFIVAGSFLTFLYFEDRFKESISIQQFALVSSVADTIDEKLRLAQNALVAAGTKVPPEVFADPDGAQRFLDFNAGLQSIFDNNTAFISLEGKLVAEGRYVAGRRGKDLSYREWYRRTVTERKPHISAPFVSTHPPHHPAVMMTVPIFDRRNRMLGMLVGSFDLLGENFLARLSRARIGKGGYFYITDERRTMIVHPDQSRIMHLAAAPGVNRLYDRAASGFEGSGETMTSYGIPMLSSCRSLRMTPWILVVNYPASEAYAPLNEVKRYFLVATMMGSVLLLLSNWLIMRHLMSPLQKIASHLEQMPEKHGSERLVSVDSSDEIGVLAKKFNCMIESIDRQQEALTAQSLLLEQEVAEREKAQKALVSKQQMLETLNGCLEERITAAVEDLRRKDRMLIQQSRQAALGEMLHNIAHQWRQPLNNLALTVQGMHLSFQMRQLGEQEMAAETARAMETITFMSRTIDDFRNYFRPDKEKRTFTVNSVVTRTLSILDGSLRRQKIAVTVQVEEDPEISGYPNEYAQVILNILTNARDAFPDESGDARIIVAIGKEGARSVVVIADNAGGIPEEILDRIFDPYFTTKGQGGSGVGLFMSKTIIEKSMGGSLTASNTAEGAEFRIVV